MLPEFERRCISETAHWNFVRPGLSACSYGALNRYRPPGDDLSIIGPVGLGAEVSGRTALSGQRTFPGSGGRHCERGLGD